MQLGTSTCILVRRSTVGPSTVVRFRSAVHATWFKPRRNISMTDTEIQAEIANQIREKLRSWQLSFANRRKTTVL